jgi:predicted Zn-ribbon and HTH transcriptional regulator
MKKRINRCNNCNFVFELLINSKHKCPKCNSRNYKKMNGVNLTEQNRRLNGLD